MTQHEDDPAVRECLAGRTGAFRILVEKYQGAVFGACRRITGNPEDAEDAAQEAFLALFLNLGKYRPGTGVGPWLGTIALNACRKKLRRKRTIRFLSITGLFPGDGPPRDVDFPARTPSVERIVESREEAGRLNRLVDALPEAHRQPLVLRYYLGMDDDAIADALETTAVNVRQRIHRARTAVWSGFAGADSPGVTTAIRRDS